MPHKKNPITGERIAGLARVIRGNAMAALENVALWHERDITHSSVERVILPDSTILLDYMLEKSIGLIEDLVVYEENMKRNLDITLGLMFSQKLMLALVGKGLMREEAYAWVQKSAMETWDTKVQLKELILKDMDIMDKLTVEKIDEIFNYDAYLVNIDYLFKRAGLE
jgi:adenylosuccinate lyase